MIEKKQGEHLLLLDIYDLQNQNRNSEAKGLISVHDVYCMW